MSLLSYKCWLNQHYIQISAIETFFYIKTKSLTAIVSHFHKAYSQDNYIYLVAMNKMPFVFKFSLYLLFKKFSLKCDILSEKVTFHLLAAVKNFWKTYI